jgi:acyl carrier protein
MNTAVSSAALDLVREVLAEYIDVSNIHVAESTELVAIGVDSLTLAEMLFALEDRVGTHVPEPVTVPTRIADLVALIEPYVDTLREQAIA